MILERKCLYSNSRRIPNFARPGKRESREQTSSLQ
ncbi:unnamed protein product [Larinioides sclopetarius]|uniref:Uncharacterized protein n=1 Tax=Larinioides sclopetarius TaxID=280406 RepID=A0AAV2AKM8_9ARAC